MMKYLIRHLDSSKYFSLKLTPDYERFVMIRVLKRKLFEILITNINSTDVSIHIIRANSIAERFFFFQNANHRIF